MSDRSDVVGELLVGQLRAEQRDRRRLADRLHDGPQQVLVSLGIRLQLLQQQLPDELAAEAEVLADQVHVARQALRHMVVDLEAPAPDTTLEDALRWLLETNGAAARWDTTLTVAPGTVVADAVRLSILRAVQELLADARLHAGARRVELSVAHDDGWVEVTVSDDGMDRCDPGVAAWRDTGTEAALDRAAALGGAGEVRRHDGRTEVRLRLPRHVAPT